MTRRHGSIDAKSIYKHCIDLEEKAADLYLRFASRFSEDKALSSFWFEMAMEEKQHADLLQLCLFERLLSSDIPADAALKRLRQLFRAAEERAADPNLSVDDAFSIAIELENSEVDVIYQRLTTPLHASSYLFRRKIQTSLPRHTEKLLAARSKFATHRQTASPHHDGF